MKTERFNIIMENLETRITEVSRRLDKLTNKTSYKNLTVAELEDMADFFPKEQGLMDKILQIELYHILGADLSPVQQSKLISRIKKYIVYRSDVKRMANWIGNGKLVIGSGPALPTKSEYQLSVLGDFKLEYDVRDGVESEDAETILETTTPTTTTSGVADIKSICTTNDDEWSISFNKADAPVVAAFFNKNIGGFKASNKGAILTAMLAPCTKKYGIVWTVKGDTCTGTALEEATYKGICKALV